MIPSLRKQFNANFTPEKYRTFLERLDRRCGTHVQFRVCETPCFFPKALLNRMVGDGTELIRQLLDNPDYMQASAAAIPPQFNVPHESRRPMFVQVDFGLVRDNDEFHPKLVELQAFPSLYAYQAALAEEYIASYRLAPELKMFLSGLDAEGYRALLRRSIIGDHATENVVLLEIDPLRQKTLPDFILTEQMLGIRTVNITDVVKHGRKLFYSPDLVPIERIYNRAIVDEIVRKGTRLPFDYRDELDVEWAGHPNWYFRISKFSIPYLRHPSVPKTWFLHELKELPADRENYLLKPLYSFAGAGILFAPSDADIAKIPLAERHNYILQERVQFTPVIETPHGMTQAEVRIMYIWPDGGELTPVLSLVRMGRGKMMGVDHNKNLEWVGGSAALYLEQ